MGQEPYPKAGQFSQRDLWWLLKGFSLYLVYKRWFPLPLNCRYCSDAVLQLPCYIAVLHEEKWRSTFPFEAIRGDPARQHVITPAGAKPKESVFSSPSAALFSALQMRDCMEHVRINETNLVSAWTSPPSCPRKT